MTDRGFLIDELTKPHRMQLYMPDFTVKGEQLSPYQFAHSRRISNIRIHVERAIGRIIGHKILSQINSIHLLPQLNEIFYMCCMLSNSDEVLL